MESTTTLDALRSLRAALAGSESFYTEASQVAKDPAFARLFASLAEQRAALGAELDMQPGVRQETPAAEGTTKDPLHETWMKMRGLLNGGDPFVLLIEAECAEDRITAKYRRLIKATAGSAMNAVLLSQLATAETARDGVRDLRDQSGKNFA